MPINPLIALGGQSMNTAPAVQQLGQSIQYKQQKDRQQEIDKQNTEYRNKQGELLDEQILDARTTRVLRNIAPKAVQLKGFLDSGNTEGAKAYLLQNRQELGSQIAQGDNVDTIETDEALQKIENGEIDLLKSELDTIIQGARLQKIIPDAQEIAEILDADQAKQKYGVELKPGTVAQAKTKDGKLVGFTVLQKSDVKSDERHQQDLEKASKGKTELSIINEANAKGLTEEQKAAAKLRVERFGEIQKQAQAAEDQNFALDQLDNIDVRQGLGTEALAQTARVINALGGDGAAFTGVDPANVQAYNAITGKQVLEIMSTQKGPQTDKDQQRIANVLPKISNEVSANEFNKNSLRALNLRRIEMNNFYESYFDEKGTLKGADREWAKFKRETPLISDGSVKNPETGLPMFFHEFEKKALEKNPDASRQQIINAWRELN